MVGYPWGSPTQIQNLVGKEDPEHPLIGELWMGVHPNAPSKIIDDPQLLEEFLKAHPHFLGGLEEFPFLFKVMAFTQPLALQVHPDAVQAKEGYAQEAEKRTRLDKTLLNYQDANQKAEMFVALNECTVMCNFRSADEIFEKFKRLLPSFYTQLIEPCRTAEDPIHAFLTMLYQLQGPLVAKVVEEFSMQLESMEDDHQGPFLSPKQIAQQALTLYEGDVGVLSPFILQVMHLNSMDAIYLEPGIMHAYVHGFGIELMTNSDNILRGGLTKKHCDTQEFLRILKTDAEPMPLLYKQIVGHKKTYCIDTVNEFSLSLFESGSSREAGAVITLLFCTEGKAVLTSKEGEILSLFRGECVVIGSSMTEYRLDVEGCLFSASYPKRS